MLNRTTFQTTGGRYGCARWFCATCAAWRFRYLRRERGDAVYNTGCRVRVGFGNRTTKDLTCRLTYRAASRTDNNAQATDLTKHKTFFYIGFFFTYDATFGDGYLANRCGFYFNTADYTSRTLNQATNYGAFGRTFATRCSSTTFGTEPYCCSTECEQLTTRATLRNDFFKFNRCNFSVGLLHNLRQSPTENNNSFQNNNVYFKELVQI